MLLLPLLGAALNLVALLLFVVAYRAPSLDQLRKAERRALLCAVVTATLVVVNVSLALVMLFAAMGGVGASGGRGQRHRARRGRGGAGDPRHRVARHLAAAT